MGCVRGAAQARAHKRSASHACQAHARGRFRDARASAHLSTCAKHCTTSRRSASTTSHNPSDAMSSRPPSRSSSRSTVDTKGSAERPGASVKGWGGGSVGGRGAGAEPAAAAPTRCRAAPMVARPPPLSPRSSSLRNLSPSPRERFRPYSRRALVPSCGRGSGGGQWGERHDAAARVRRPASPSLTPCLPTPPPHLDAHALQALALGGV